MKLIVMGYKRHGKDAVCELIKARHGKTFISSSWFCCKKFIFDELKDIHDYATPEECFEDRVNHRKYWYESIRNYNSKDRARLGRDIFAIHDVYCGIRDLQELDAIKAAGLVDYVIWVDASARLPPEYLSSMNISIKHADMYINNNGIEHDLPEQVDMVMKTAIEAFYYRTG